MNVGTNTRPIRSDVIDLFPSITRATFDGPPEHLKCGRCGASVAYHSDLDLLRRCVPEDEIERLTAATMRGVDRSLPERAAPPTKPCGCVAEDDAAETKYANHKHRCAPTDSFRTRLAADVRELHRSPASRTFGLTAPLDSAAKRWPVWSLASANVNADRESEHGDAEIDRVFELLWFNRKLAAEVAARRVLKRVLEPARNLDAAILDEARRVRQEQERAERRARWHDSVDPWDDDGIDPSAPVDPLPDPIGDAREVIAPDWSPADWSRIAAARRAQGVTTASAYARAVAETVDACAPDRAAELLTPQRVTFFYMVEFDVPAAEYPATHDRVKSALAAYRRSRGSRPYESEGDRAADSPRGRPSKCTA